MNTPLRHALCILILAVACLIVRLPSLDRIALNPDESQYEATASYLLATGASPYSFPYGTVTTFALYKTMAALFGPYCMLEVRLLVLLVCLAMAVMLYFLVSRAASPWSGLLSGLVFLHYNLFFEGLSANREWFSGFLILAAFLIFVLGESRRGAKRLVMIAAAGLAAGCSLWFKLQAAFLLLPIPVVLLWLGATGGRMKAAAGRIAAYCAGALAAVALHMLPFLAAGTLPKYLESLTTRWSTYVLGNEAATGSLPSRSLGLLFDRLLWELPQRSLLLVAYSAAILLVLAALLSTLRKRKRKLPLAGDPTALLFVLYLVAGAMAVKMGNLFFDHYYLYIVPPVAGLVGMAAHFFGRVDRGAMIGRVAGMALIVLLLADRLTALRGASLAQAVIPLAYVVMAVALLGIVAWRPSRLIPAVVVAMLWLETGAVALQSQVLKRPDSLPFHRQGFSELVGRIEASKEAGDRLFVWGWAPEIYSLTGMEAASHFSMTQYIVNDYRVDPAEPELDRFFADMLMRDLEERRPRFVVDAWRRSWTMNSSNDPWLYRLELYPEFELKDFLESHYELAGRFDDCDLYIRN
jgi:hypothetical protein